MPPRTSRPGVDPRSLILKYLSRRVRGRLSSSVNGVTYALSRDVRARSTGSLPYVEEPINTGPVPEAQQGQANQQGQAKQPPELSERLLDAWAAGITGTSAWFVAFIVLLIVGVAQVWIFTALAGTVLGLLGMALMYWQRSASRRGSRSAQRGL